MVQPPDPDATAVFPPDSENVKLDEKFDSGPQDGPQFGYNPSGGDDKQPGKDVQYYCYVPVPSGRPEYPYIYQCMPLPSRNGQPVLLPAIPAGVPLPFPLLYMGGLTGPVERNPQYSSIDSIAPLGIFSENKPLKPACPEARPESRPVIPPAVLPIQPGNPGESGNKPARKHTCGIQDEWGRVCKRKFVRPYDLIRHKETVHGSGQPKVYHCAICGGASNPYSRSDSLSRHIRRMHKMDPEMVRKMVNNALTASRMLYVKFRPRGSGEETESEGDDKDDNEVKDENNEDEDEDDDDGNL